MNKLECARFYDFQSKHKEARRIWIEYSHGGIGPRYVAKAKYWITTIEEDVTDYDSW